MNETVTIHDRHGAGLTTLRDTLLVQCRPRDVAPVAEALADYPHSGIVVTTSKNREAAAAVEQFGRPGRTLVDAEGYAGKNRARGEQAFSRPWIDLQRELGLVVVPDAGYIDAGDESGLRAVLSQTAALNVEAVAPLALHAWWWDPSGGLSILRQRIAEYAVPVALILEHSGDPLGVKRTLRSVVTTIREAPVPVLVLRCDISVLGLLCHGAHAAAVGTTTTLRHNYPISAGGGGRPAAVAAMVASCLAYKKIELIALAVQADPDNQMWVCHCRTCAGRTMDWIQQLPPGEQEAAAFGHSIQTLQLLRDDLLVSGSTREQRIASWASHCDNALFQFEQVGRGDDEWQAPSMLGNWRSIAAPTPARLS